LRVTLEKFAQYPKAPMVAVHWYDACFDSSERIYGEVESNYRAGCPDILVGFYHGVHDRCVVISTSAYVREGKPDNHRHIWNIPVGMIIRVDRLEFRPADTKGAIE
jgi:hypothetical protein